MMTQFNFTLDFDNIKEEIMQSNLNDVVKSTIILVFNQYMEKERDAYMENLPYDRNPERKDYRNGYYERDYILNVGAIKLKVPRTRSGEFSTELFEKYKRCDQAFVGSMMEMVVNGVSTRKVTNIVEQLCGETVSKSMVSDVTEELKPIVEEWANRRLHRYYRYVYVDAMYIKVREYHKVVSKAVYLAMGVNTEDRREILGFEIADQESKHNWSTFFDSLICRGLQTPELIISDAHEGLKGAIQEKFIGTSWQRCTVHFLRNLMERMPKKNTKEARTHLKEIFKARSLEVSRTLKNEFIEEYGEYQRFEETIKRLEEGFDEATQFYAEPVDTHVHIRTTNSLERLNSEIRRREQVIQIFPNTSSSYRLIGAVLMDLDESLDQGNKRFFYRTT